MNETITRIGRWFRNTAQSYQDRSPLYAHLASAIAGDPALLEMAVSPLRQPPHILLAAVHYLLLSGTEHPLRDFYPSVTESDDPPGDAWPAFRSFCHEFEREIRFLVASRLVQTNEVTRCSGLYLAFGRIARMAEGRPLSLVEVGAAAGLNLLFDRYAYSYNGMRAGDPSSKVLVGSELRGDLMPDIPARPPRIAFRCGIDLNPIDVDNRDEMLWLRSLVWPEQRERVELLTNAADVVRTHRPPLVRGNALDCLPAVASAAPSDSILCVYHTHTIHTWSDADRERLTGFLSDLSRLRTVYRLSTEWLQEPAPRLELTCWNSGEAATLLLARCDDHGRWIEWIASPDL